MSFVVLICLATVSFVHADVSHINSLNVPQQAYFYRNPPPSPHQVPSQFSPQLKQKLQHPQLFHHEIQDNLPLAIPINARENLAANVKPVNRRPRPRVKIPKKPIVSKSFYVHTAPEETEAELLEEMKQLEERPRKHFNVIFVKTPAQTSKSSALNLAKALKGDEKTVVYVLSKKTTANDLRDAISEGPQQITKPDVFFIKYRTPEEAAHAQRQIQSQYDTLEGPSTITDEGTGPVASVIGSLDPTDEEEEFSEEQHDEQLVKTSAEDDKTKSLYYGEPYLPPNRI